MIGRPRSDQRLPHGRHCRFLVGNPALAVLEMEMEVQRFLGDVRGRSRRGDILSTYRLRTKKHYDRLLGLRLRKQPLKGLFRNLNCVSIERHRRLLQLPSRNQSYFHDESISQHELSSTTLPWLTTTRSMSLNPPTVLP